MSTASSGPAVERVSLRDGSTAWIFAEGNAPADRVALGEPGPRTAGGAPLQVDVILLRQPHVDEVRIGHLVSAIRPTFDITLVPRHAVLQELAAARGREARPAASRFCGTVLVDEAGREILGATAGSDGRILLGGTLSGPDADAFVADLFGARNLRLKTSVVVRTSPSAHRLSVAGRWGDVWMALGARRGEVVSYEDVRAAVERLLQDGLLRVSADPAPEAEPTDAVARLLWSRRMLLGKDLDEDRLRLEPVVADDDVFRATESVVLGKEQRLEGEIALHDWIVRNGFSPDDVVSLQVAGTVTRQPELVTPPLVARRARTDRMRPIAFSSRPGASSLMTAGKLIATPIHLPVGTAFHGVRPTVDLALAPSTPPSGPLVSDTSADDWPDTRDRRRRWFAPVPRLEQGGGDAPLFVLHKEGLTAAGDVALRAEITIPFRFVDPSRADAGRHPVETKSTTVELELPFRDASSDNQRMTHRLRGDLREIDGLRVARFEALNGWARIAYGALSSDEADPARVIVSYRFQGYQEVALPDQPGKTFGATLIRPGVVGGLMFDPVKRTVEHPIGRFQLNLERLGQVRPPRLFAAQFQKSSATRTRLVSRDFTRSTTLEIRRPCSDHPQDYVERQGESALVIGCQQAFRLGTIAYRQFHEIAALRTGRLSVYQSLTEAGVYMVVPRTYRVGRRPDDGTETGLRPLAVLHAAVGVDPEDVEVLFEVGLQPDLRPIDRFELDAEIRRLDPHARMTWPTEVHGVTSQFFWTAASTLSETITSVALPDGTIHFSIGLDVPAWMVLRGLLSASGLSGAVHFDFPDGTRVSSELSIDLRRIVGPWASGPVRVRRIDGGIELHNPVAAPIAVALVAAFGAGDTVDSTAVDLVLAPDETVSVPWEPAEAALLATDHEVVAGDPVTVEEVRSFVEEVEVSVVLINQLGNSQTVTVEAHIDGHQPLRRVELERGVDAVEIGFPLPLTAALALPVLRFRVVHEGSQGVWRSHELAMSAFAILTTQDLPSPRSRNGIPSRSSELLPVEGQASLAHG